LEKYLLMQLITYLDELNLYFLHINKNQAQFCLFSLKSMIFILFLNSPASSAEKSRVIFQSKGASYFGITFATFDYNPVF
jgi:hypothetical protein